MENARAYNRLQKIVPGYDVNQRAMLSASEVSGNAVFWDRLTVPVPDEVFNVNGKCKADKDPRTINLGVGAYRDANGKPYILNVVKKAAEKMVADRTFNHEYLGINGDGVFAKAAAKLVFGEHKRMEEGHIASTQSLSGTGALRLATEFIALHMPKGTTVYSSSPTWGNHKDITVKAGLAYKTYRYWHAPTRGFDLKGMLEDLNAAPNGSAIMLHACAHNPTGVDPTQAQWKEIATVMRAKAHLPLFDSAYQGFASGSLEKDAYAVRYFLDQGFEMVLCQSFAKNFGLYNARVGAFHVVTSSKVQATAANAQVAKIVRPMYSNPPVEGAYIVKTVLNDPALFREWCGELETMSGRILEMRALLRSKIEALHTPGDWSHITNQIGMFSFTGLSKPQCARLISEHHVYLLSSGRISMAGVNHHNVDHLAKSINEVVKNSK
jgi:aspartate/tyrosine/aromatic aminotransferase